MNIIFFALIVSAVVYAAFAGTMEAVSQASIESAKSAVTLAIGLIGVMAFWLGMMRIVREGGFLHTLARWVRPLMTRLFPDVPADHPAMSAMILNIAANMLGLANAATPFGIKAMMELDRLNPVPGVATNAMVLFLAINTSNVALAPLGVIGLRAAMGSSDPAGIWIPTLLATLFSTLVGIAAAKLLQRAVPPIEAYEADDTPTQGARVAPATDAELGAQRETSPRGCLVAVGFALLIVVALVMTVTRGIGEGAAAMEIVRGILSAWLLPILIGVILCYGVAKRVALYDVAIAGAREGFDVAVRIIPYLVAILVAAGMLRASGLLGAFVSLIGPATSAVGLPPEAVPMALLRPLSGSGAYAIMAEIMQAEGVDSRVGYLVSTLQGSTETTFYVLAVYFGAVGVSRIRHALAAGLIADLAGIVGAVAAVALLLA
jgi:spore maturation protein SpmA